MLTWQRFVALGVGLALTQSACTAEVVGHLRAQFNDIVVRDKTSDYGKMIREWGVEEFRPPLPDLKPGTVVYLTGRQPFQGDVVCSAEEALGQGMQSKIRESRTLVQNARKKKENQVTLATALYGGAGSQHVKAITMKFKNVRILDVSDVVVLDGLTRMSESCKRAIQVRQEAGDDVRMIRKAMRASLDFDVAFQNADDLSMQKMEKLREQVAYEVGGKMSGQGKTTGGGADLIWGVTLSDFGIKKTEKAPVEPAP